MSAIGFVFAKRMHEVTGVPIGLIDTSIGGTTVVVPETEIDKVELGAIAGARLATGREVVGQVTFMSRSADPTTRTFRVEMSVPNGDLSIRDGQTADILIEADGAQAHLLPQSALTLNNNGDLGVRVVDDGKSMFTQVSILRDTSKGVWVNGL